MGFKKMSFPLWILATLLLAYGVLRECYCVWSDYHALIGAIVTAWKTTDVPSGDGELDDVGNGPIDDIHWELLSVMRVPDYRAFVLAYPPIHVGMNSPQEFNYVVARPQHGVTVRYYLELNSSRPNFFEWQRIHGIHYAVLRSLFNPITHVAGLILMPIWFISPDVANGFMHFLITLRSIFMGTLLFYASVLQFTAELLVRPIRSQ